MESSSKAASTLNVVCRGLQFLQVDRSRDQTWANEAAEDFTMDVAPDIIEAGTAYLLKELKDSRILPAFLTQIRTAFLNALRNAGRDAEATELETIFTTVSSHERDEGSAFEEVKRREGADTTPSEGTEPPNPGPSIFHPPGHENAGGVT